MWDLPGPGIKPTLRALAGVFLPTEALGKSPDYGFSIQETGYKGVI